MFTAICVGDASYSMKGTYGLILLMSKQLGDRWSNGVKAMFSMQGSGGRQVGITSVVNKVRVTDSVPARVQRQRHKAGKRIKKTKEIHENFEESLWLARQ
jgi:hypothetical protein